MNFIYCFVAVSRGDLIILPSLDINVNNFFIFLIHNFFIFLIHIFYFLIHTTFLFIVFNPSMTQPFYSSEYYIKTIYNKSMKCYFLRCNIILSTINEQIQKKTQKQFLVVRDLNTLRQTN